MLVITDTYFTLFGCAVQAYGCFILLGLLAFMFVFMTFSAPRLKMTLDDSLSLVLCCTLAAVFGGRLAYLLGGYEVAGYSFLGAFNVWGGGLSIMGSLVSVPLVLVVWGWFYQINVAVLLDEVCKSVPIADFFGRLGCLFGGCCYGEFSLFMPVMYQDSFAAAPCDIPLFPVQALTALLFLAVFCVFSIMRSRFDFSTGFFTAAYFSSAAFIRFGVDFLRGDRGTMLFSVGSVGITSYQIWCLALGAIASVVLISLLLKKHTKSEAV